MLVESDLNLYSFLQVVHCRRVDAVAFTLRICFIVQLQMDGYGMYLLEGLDGLACWSRLDHLVLNSEQTQEKAPAGWGGLSDSQAAAGQWPSPLCTGRDHSAAQDWLWQGSARCSRMLSTVVRGGAESHQGAHQQAAGGPRSPSVIFAERCPTHPLSRA